MTWSGDPCLERDPVLAARVERLLTIPCIEPVTALTWVLEVGEVSRFSSSKYAVSYCGLCSAERSSAGIHKRSPISKQRDKHLQTVLVEAAKLSDHFNAELTLVHEEALLKGNRNPGRPPSGCFEAAGNPNSIFGDGAFSLAASLLAREKRLETANGCLVPRIAGTAAERHSRDLTPCYIYPRRLFEHVERATPSALLTLLIMDDTDFQTPTSSSTFVSQRGRNHRFLIVRRRSESPDCPSRKLAKTRLWSRMRIPEA